MIKKKPTKYKRNKLYIVHYACIRWYCSNRRRKRNVKTKDAPQYPKIVEMYDIITMIATQMIDGERLNPAQTWMSDDKAQSASFETLTTMKVELTRRNNKGCFINDDSMFLDIFFSTITFCP